MTVQAIFLRQESLLKLHELKLMRIMTVVKHAFVLGLVVEVIIFSAIVFYYTSGNLKFKSSKQHLRSIPKHLRLPVGYFKPNASCYAHRRKTLDVYRQEFEDLQCKQNFPSAIIVGAKKCGAGALRFFLSSHPQIIFPDLLDVNYFSNSRKKPFDWYQRQMPFTASHEIAVEKSIEYFTSITAPPLIYKHISPQTKIIVVLRDPVFRAISDYVLLNASKEFNNASLSVSKNLRKNPPKVPYKNPKYDIRETFESSVEGEGGSILEWNALVNIGFYDTHLRRWLKYFRLEQILVIDADDFAKHPYKIMTNLEEFLEVKSFFERNDFTLDQNNAFYCSIKKKKCYNNERQSYPKVDTHVIKKLRKVYGTHVEALNTILGRNLSWTGL